MTRKPREILPLLAPLEAVHRLLERFDGVIIGGVAASILGKPRLTADVDVMILLSVDDLPAFLEAAAQEGLEPRIPDALDFARRHRVLLLRHRESGINVDISLGILPFEQEAVERSQVHRIGSIELRLPTPEDFIIFKAVAHRPVDLEDIRAVIAKHPNLDRERIRRWIQAFAEVLEMPELWEDIAPLLEER
ncbi:MAG TPA: hypothetical protein ENG33_06875 [Chloroflexi bacterium]|nr:hypothetical protein [Chloroflexota bacterium]